MSPSLTQWVSITKFSNSFTPTGILGSFDHHSHLENFLLLELSYARYLNVIAVHLTWKIKHCGRTTLINTSCLKNMMTFVFFDEEKNKKKMSVSRTLVQGTYSMAACKNIRLDNQNAWHLALAQMSISLLDFPWEWSTILATAQLAVPPWMSFKQMIYLWDCVSFCTIPRTEIPHKRSKERLMIWRGERVWSKA